ncbi:MAG: hypothetical protein F6J93_07005 [Oscillatoria sp. SIO1A7]|nr:hypothetical protein [Oscillatoria sp. SIO1A7]
MRGATPYKQRLCVSPKDLSRGVGGACPRRAYGIRPEVLLVGAIPNSALPKKALLLCCSAALAFRDLQVNNVPVQGLCPGGQAAPTTPRAPERRRSSAIARTVTVKERSWTGTKFAAQVP